MSMSEIINTKKCQSFRFRLRKAGKQWYENQHSQAVCANVNQENDKPDCCAINHNNATNKCVQPSVIVSLPYCEIGKKYFYSYAMLDSRKNFCSPPESGVSFCYATPHDEFCNEDRRPSTFPMCLGLCIGSDEWEDPNTCQVFPRHDVKDGENSWLRQTLESHENWLTTLLSD